MGTFVYNFFDVDGRCVDTAVFYVQSGDVEIAEFRASEYASEYGFYSWQLD